MTWSNPPASGNESGSPFRGRFPCPHGFIRARYNLVV